MYPSFLVIDDDRVELRGADYLWGKDTHTVQKILEKELGKDFSIAQIGPAGENLVRFEMCIRDRYSRLPYFHQSKKAHFPAGYSLY